MDAKLREIIETKIKDSLSKTDEISQIVKSLEGLATKTDSFAYGIVIGRLYNSFYYQCRRILKRDPTKQEFFEFMEILKNKQTEFLEKLK